MMMRNYILFVFILFIANLNLLKAENQNDSISSAEITENGQTNALSRADNAYKNKNFATSIKLYEAEVSKNRAINKESSQIYYNLGNAYFRDNQIARAILNYERALLLDPGDSDIRHNLRFARTRIEDKIDSVDNLVISNWVRSIQNLYSSNQWATIGIIFFIMLLFAVGVYAISAKLIWRKISFYAGIILLVLVMISNTFAFKQKNKIRNRSTGIVMSASVSVYTSPDAHSQELFRLHEGSKVRIKREEGRWIEIVIANGSVGWLQMKNIEVI